MALEKEIELAVELRTTPAPVWLLPDLNMDSAEVLGSEEEESGWPLRIARMAPTPVPPAEVSRLLVGVR